MRFEEIRSEGMKHEYRVIFAAAEIEDEILKIVKDQAKTFKIPGFREGHVPINIVRKNIEDRILKDVFEELIAKASQEIIQKIGCDDLAMQPTYRFNTKYQKNKDVELTMVIETAPDFELQEFDAKFIKIIPNVTEEDIEDAKKTIMKNSPIYEPANKDYEIKNGDEVSYKATCFVGEIESKKKSFENSLIVPETLPDDAEFFLGFVGKKIGESFDFVPPTNENLKYNVRIKSIKQVLSDISEEEYYKKKGFENEEAFRNFLTTFIEREINSEAFIYHKHQILEYLSGKYKFNLPQSVLNYEMNSVLATIKSDLEEEKKQGIISDEDLRKTDEEWSEEYIDIVRKRVLLAYVFNKIAKIEGITVSDEEIKNAVMLEIQNNPSMASYIIDLYSNNRDAVTYKKAELIEHKVILYLMSKAQVEEKKMTKEEVKELVEEVLEN